MTEHDNYIRKTFCAVFFSLLVLLLLGVVGYVLIEGWDSLDALYMSVIAFSTVGFREVGSFGMYGRIFTMFIVLFGLVLLSMLSASVTTLLVRRELLPGFKKRKMKYVIKNLKGHTILCGHGETGKTVIEEFRQTCKPLVVIDREKGVLGELREIYPDLLVLEGDATKDEVLPKRTLKRQAA